MKTLPVGEFKSQLSDILMQVRKGKHFYLSFGKKKERVAVLVPYQDYHANKPTRILGLLKNKGKVKIPADFKLSDEEFLTS